MLTLQEVDRCRAAVAITAATSQAQCRDGGFAIFGFETEDECLSFVASQAKNEPAEGQKE